MNKAILTSFVMLGAVYLAQPVFANEGMYEKSKEAIQAATAPVVAQAVEVGNKICPVSGEKVGEMGEIVKHEYNGKVYNLCCAMCANDFNKDSKKYSKIAEDEVAAQTGS